MGNGSSNLLKVNPAYQPIFREIGLDAEAIFSHPDIVVWRKLPDRENCTLDADLADGTHVRWHVKRYESTRGSSKPAEDDVTGQQALTAAGIPTLKLVAWGSVADGRSFVITEDLAGYLAADKLIDSADDFDRFGPPIAELAARLHGAGLHHRDLYLCHFFVKPAPASAIDVRLIDTARVKRLPTLFTRNRWIVKDLAQLWYSTLKLPVTEAQRAVWLSSYAKARGLGSTQELQRAIERKAKWIGRHDAKLNQEQPTRNVSIPE